LRVLLDLDGRRGRWGGVVAAEPAAGEWVEDVFRPSLDGPQSAVASAATGTSHFAVALRHHGRVSTSASLSPSTPGAPGIARSLPRVVRVGERLPRQ
jgi:hypothetical protein